MKTSAIRMIVFDMAGTVVNEHNVVYKTLKKALGKGGYHFSLEEVLSSAGGKEKSQAINDLIHQSESPGGLSGSEVYRIFLNQLDEAYARQEVTSYPGVEALLRRLRDRNIKITLNTGYNRNTATQLLEKMNWQPGREYDLLVTADDVANSRPAPDMIFLAMEKLGIESASAVAKVGDSVIDIEEGQVAGCGVTVGVTTGAHAREELKKVEPTYILDSLENLDELLLKQKEVNS